MSCSRAVSSFVSFFLPSLMVVVIVVALVFLEGVRGASLLDCTSDRPGWASHRKLYVPRNMVNKIRNKKNAEKKAHVTALCCVYTHVEKIATGEAPYMITYDGSRVSYNNVDTDDFVALAEMVMGDVCAMSMGSVDCNNQEECTDDAFCYDDLTFKYKNKKGYCKKLKKKSETFITKKCTKFADIQKACSETCGTC